jgi:GH24 family phage-related lysozyme (muramidase)
MPTVSLSKSLLDKLYAFTVPFEGVTDYMYLDVKGYVTVGVGFLLSTPVEAAKMGMTPADHVGVDWAAVKALPSGKVASWYKDHTVSRLSVKGMRAEFDRRIKEMAVTLRKVYKFETWPEACQVALLDMSYNVGAGGMTKPGSWRNFKAACQIQDWAIAAQECARKDVQPQRNKATAALFSSALNGIV